MKWVILNLKVINTTQDWRQIHVLYCWTLFPILSFQAWVNPNSAQNLFNIIGRACTEDQVIKSGLSQVQVKGKFIMLNELIICLHSFLGNETIGFHLIKNVSSFLQKNSQTIKSQKQLLYKFIANAPFRTVPDPITGKSKENNFEDS